MTGLAAPLGDAIFTTLLSRGDDPFEAVPHGIHPGEADEIEVDAVGVPPGRDNGDQRLGEGLMPQLVLSDELSEIALLIGVCSSSGCNLVLKQGDVLPHRSFGIAIWLEKSRITGGLIAAQSRLFVDNQLLDKYSKGNSLVGLLNEDDCGVGAVDLKDKYAS